MRLAHNCVSIVQYLLLLALYNGVATNRVPLLLLLYFDPNFGTLL